MSIVYIYLCVGIRIYGIIESAVPVHGNDTVYGLFLSLSLSVPAAMAVIYNTYGTPIKSLRILIFNLTDIWLVCGAFNEGNKIWPERNGTTNTPELFYEVE